MSDEKWGVGDQANAKAFDKTWVGEDPEHAYPVEIIHGQHPHSRSDNSFYARREDGTIDEFDGHRLLHDVQFREYNYLKTSSLSGNEIRKGGSCVIRINGLICGEFFFRDVMEAVLSARTLIQKIHDHPIQIWDTAERAKLVGRKIFYENYPAYIERFIGDQACVIIRPQNGLLPISAFELEDDFPSGEGREYVKDCIHSPRIWWFRDK